MGEREAVCLPQPPSVSSASSTQVQENIHRAPRALFEGLWLHHRGGEDGWDVYSCPWLAGGFSPTELQAELCRDHLQRGGSGSKGQRANPWRQLPAALAAQDECGGAGQEQRAAGLWLRVCVEVFWVRV